MKKLTLLFTIVFLAIIVALPAHPANVVNANFDKESNLLAINFLHKVKNNADHYIKEVVVMKGKTELIRQELTYQDSMEGGALIYKINNLKPNDKLVITTTCNKTGKKSQTLEIK